MNEQDPADYYTVKEVAQKLRLTTQAVYRLLDAQVIESVYIGRLRRVDRASYDLYRQGLPTTAPVADDEVA